MSLPRFSTIKCFSHFLLSISSCSLFLAFNSILNSSPSLAAEEIVIRYGLFEESLSVADLRKYAETQQVSDDLKSILGYLSSQQQQKLQKVLQMKIPLGVVALDKLVNSETGKIALNFVAPAIARRDNAGIQALRSAIILGAASSKGLGVISFLEAYPSQRLVVNLPTALDIVNKADFFSSFSGFLLTDDFGTTLLSPLEF
ncbi:alpha/beta hydrolase [Chlorogloeopsis fritschii PCC 9212]|uniref:alpha/beta hydrolase n=1 Tax=Chlorogloeopsis fritschii TaxID=1124 RepID=UPI000370A710|nr:alpha/beta hydrolase [Chlorogloeopsis fritschii]MBF2007535.1 alpha/beta hydrolase [Chlorogloeopsis fritschii C42_A2020_084]